MSGPRSPETSPRPIRSPLARFCILASGWFFIVLGILGLFLADPIVAMIKVYLEERSKASRSDRDKALLQPADG